MSVTVRTVQELKSAITNKESEILVVGTLAGKVKMIKKLMTFSPIALGILGVALAAIPPSGGLSALAAVPAAAVLGLSTFEFCFLAALGIGAAVMLIGKYDLKVKYRDGKVLEVRLERKPGSAAEK